MVSLLRCISLTHSLALTDALLVRGFVTPHNIAHTRTFVDNQSFQRKLQLYSRGNEDDAVSLDLGQIVEDPPSSAAESLNVTLADPSSFVNQSGDNSVSNVISFFSSRNVIAIIVAVATFLALSQLPQMRVLATVVITTYSTLLANYPLPTKSLTSGALCGVSDAIAQYREANRKQFNFKRWIRFAGKSLPRVGFEYRILHRLSAFNSVLEQLPTQIYLHADAREMYFSIQETRY